MDWNIIVSMFTALTGGGLGWLLSSNRRKAAAEATLTEAQALAATHGNYKETIEFLQKEINSYTMEAAANGREVCRLSKELQEVSLRVAQLEVMYAMSRCDKKDCQWREPPLRLEIKNTGDEKDR